jgi:hypothetical protein
MLIVAGAKGVRSDAPSLWFPATNQRWSDEGKTTMLKGKSNGRSNSAATLSDIFMLKVAMAKQ